MENTESLCCRVLHLADQWSEIQRLVDAAVGGNYRSSRGGRSRVTEGASNRRGGEVKNEQRGRGPSAIFESSDIENNYGARKYQGLGGAKEILDRGQSPSFTYRKSGPQCLLHNPDARPVRRSDFPGRTVHHRGDTFFPRDTGIGGTTV